MLKEIENYSNYLVSDDGRIFNNRGGEIKQRLNRDGYPTIFLWKNNKGTCYCVHRRVAIAFLPNPENKPCVNHKDGNKANNFFVFNVKFDAYLERSTTIESTPKGGSE